jgi:enoyl-CoA hydratase/carnithine racemase
MARKHAHNEREGRVALVRFDRGDNLNALSLQALRELVEAAESLGEDLETASVVLTGPNQAICAGLDLEDPELIRAMQSPLGKRRRLLGFGPRLCRA